MPDTQILSESVPKAARETEGLARASSLRFTPLRSATIARECSRKTNSDRILSRLVPARRLQS